jgi:peptidyl-prolyl cis-trans isomerase D
MFDLVHRNKRIIQVILAIVLLPFAFFGVDSYFRDSPSGRAVATVGDYEISEQEFTNSLQQRQTQLREMSGGRIDPALLDSSEMRFSVLESLVRERLLIQHAARSGMTASTEQLRGYISQYPALQEDGKFSMARYEQLLKGRGQTVQGFENGIRQQLLLAQLAEAYAGTSIAPRSVAERLLRITDQKREISRSVFPADKYMGAVKLEADAAKKYYEGHQDEFRLPEQVRVQYVALTLDSLMAEIQADPAELKKYYDAHQRDYGVPESRQASHILIAVDKSAAPEAKAKARALAEQVSGEAKKNPAAFPELAKKHSQDPGSAANGGDLGSFSRGSMVKAFDDAVFNMKVGEVSAPVESEYGYHVIRLTGITPGQMKTFEQVRPAIEKEVKKQLAGRRFAELADKFNNTAFEQSDSLKGVAEIAKVAPRESGWLSRTGGQEPLLNNPKLLEAIFSEDVRMNKRNTEAVEIAPGTVVVARVMEHKPSTLKPLAEVQAEIEKKLVRNRAAQLAAQEARQQLEQLRQGKAPQLAWDAPQLVSRTDPKGLPETVVRQAFKADVSKLPSYTGLELPDLGFVLLRVSRVEDTQKVDVAQQKSITEELGKMLGEEQFSAYVASLKQKTKIKLDKEQFDKKQQ